jgi:hypothetical protein
MGAALSPGGCEDECVEEMSITLVPCSPLNRYCRGCKATAFFFLSLFCLYKCFTLDGGIILEFRDKQKT